MIARLEGETATYDVGFYHVNNYAMKLSSDGIYIIGNNLSSLDRKTYLNYLKKIEETLEWNHTTRVDMMWNQQFSLPTDQPTNNQPTNKQPVNLPTIQQFKLINRDSKKQKEENYAMLYSHNQLYIHICMQKHIQHN